MTTDELLNKGEPDEYGIYPAYTDAEMEELRANAAVMAQARAERRFKVVGIDPDYLFRMLTGEVTLALSLPKRTQAVNVSYDYGYGSVIFCVCHPSFDPVPEGQQAPSDMSLLVRCNVK